jgi:hypothetical protein
MNATRTHHIIRVNDGENLRNSVNPYWGVTDAAGQKSKVEKMRRGDVLWFLTSKPYGGKCIGMAEYAGWSDRKKDPEFKGHLTANAEQGWVGDKEWDILIHYEEFCDVNAHDIIGCIQCVGNILPYETFKDKITKNLYEMHAQIKNLNSANSSALVDTSEDEDAKILRVAQLLREKKEKKRFDNLENDIANLRETLVGELGYFGKFVHVEERKQIIKTTFCETEMT